MSKEQPMIVYVEDDMLSRTMMEFLMKNVMELKDVEIFETSHNFMERVRALPRIPDVFFLDIQIGPHDGYAMLRMLRSDEKYKDVKVIALTANVMATHVSKLRTAGFNGLLGKPIEKREFPELLSKILAGEPVWRIIA